MSYVFKNVLVAVASVREPDTGQKQEVLESARQKIIDLACELAVALKARMTFIHVVTLPAVVEPGFPMDPTPFQQAGERVLERTKKMAKEKGFEADTILETTFGNAAQKILKVAEEKQFDLIIVGARGQSRLRNLLVGSVCDSVFRMAKVPVLVVR